MDINLLIERKRERFAELERDIADPHLFDNRKRAGEIMREHASVKQLLERWNELEAAQRQLDDNRELVTSRDVEIAAMADDEIPDLEKRVVDLDRLLAQAAGCPSAGTIDQPSTAQRGIVNLPRICTRELR